MKTRSWEYLALLEKEDKEDVSLEEERWARRVMFWPGGSTGRFKIISG